MSLSIILVYPIIAALMAGQNFLDKNVKFETNNAVQKYFVESVIPKIKISEISTILSSNDNRTFITRNDKDLNKQFSDFNKKFKLGYKVEENNFFKPLNSSEFGIFSFVNLNLELSQIEETLFDYGNKSYRGVHLKNNFEILISDNFWNPFIKINAKNGDTIFMVLTDKKLDGFELLEKIIELKKLNKKKSKEFNFNSIVFPKIVINNQINVDWLKGLKSKNMTLTQVIQHIKFEVSKYNPNSNISVIDPILSVFNIYRRNNVYYINQPFYLWIERQGCSLPIFVGYMDQSTWSQDKSFLEKINDKFN